MKKLVLLACVIGVVSCGDDGAESLDVQIDTFNVALAGAFIPHEQARRAPILEAIRQMESDIVCLQEVWEQADKDMITAGVSDTFPHVVSFTTDYSTPIDDATAQDGSVPDPFTTAPCESAALQPQVEAAIQCLQDNCNTMPGSDLGQTTSSACAQEQCIEEVTTLLLGADEALRCYSCLATSLPVENFQEMRNLCSTEVGADIAYRGQSSVMILSRHPLTNADNFVMPGTWNRRIVATATAELPNGVGVDVYCNHLTPVFDSLAFPYTGQYGDDRVGKDGWAAEQQLQAQKLLNYINGRSGSDTPAFVLGDLNAGRAFPDQNIFEESPTTLDILEGQLVQAVTPDYVPACSHCPDNAVAGDATTPVWIDHIYMQNIDVENVLSTELTYTERTVMAGGEMVPLSDHYGLRSVVTID